MTDLWERCPKCAGPTHNKRGAKMTDKPTDPLAWVAEILNRRVAHGSLDRDYKYDPDIIDLCKIVREQHARIAAIDENRAVSDAVLEGKIKEQAAEIERLRSEYAAARGVLVKERSPEWADQAIAYDLAKERADQAEDERDQLREENKRLRKAVTYFLDDQGQDCNCRGCKLARAALNQKGNE